MTLETSIVFALLSRKDPNHQRIKNTLLTYAPPYLIPTGVLAEIAYLLEQRLGFHTLDAFLNDLQAGVFRLEHDPADLRRAHEIARKYQNLALGLSNALVIAYAERHGGLVMSLDRHFWVVAGEGKIQIVS